MTSRYEDILHLPHHVSKTRPQMSMLDRAAQFSPFADLTGYDAAIRETGRLTDARIELEEEALALLDMKIQILAEHLTTQPEVTVTYFRQDEKKSGGAYLTITGTVRKIDEHERLLVMQDSAKIPMDDILNLQSDLFAPLQE